MESALTNGTGHPSWAQAAVTETSGLFLSLSEWDGSAQSSWSLSCFYSSVERELGPIMLDHRGIMKKQMMIHSSSAVLHVLHLHQRFGAFYSEELALAGELLVQHSGCAVTLFCAWNRGRPGMFQKMTRPDLHFPPWLGLSPLETVCVHGWFPAVRPLSLLIVLLKAHVFMCLCFMMLILLMS